MSKASKTTPFSDGKRRKMKMNKLTAIALTAQGANPHADVTFYKSIDKPILPEEKNMGDQNKTELEIELTEKNEDLQNQIESLNKKLETANQIGVLTDAHKTYFQTLDDAGKEEFLGKSDKERDAVLDALKTDDPVVYTAIDGSVFKKSDDPRLIEMVKRSDKNERELAKAKTEKENMAFAKRAKEEFNHLPGNEAAQVALLKAVSKIEDQELRTDAEKILKAHSEKFDDAFKTFGSSGDGGDQTTTEKLDALAKKYADENSMSFSKAYLKVLETEAGQQLYNDLHS